MRGLRRLFCGLDTTACDLALAQLDQSQHDMTVRARALRMDVSCGAPGEAIERLTARMRKGAGRWLHFFYDDAAEEPLPADLQGLLNQIP